MNWLILVLVATFLEAIRIFIDNYLSDVFFKDRLAVSQKVFTSITELFFALIILIICGFNFGQTELSVFFIIILSGAIGAIAAIPYYRALEIEESTNIGIFIQLAPILYIIFGYFFLGESFSLNQLLAIFIILLAPALIVATTRKRSRKIKIRAVCYAFLYVFIAVIGNLVFVKANGFPSNELSFMEQIAFLYIGLGSTNLILVSMMPKWRKRFFSVAKKHKAKLLVPLFFNHVISLVKSICYRAGLIAAPVVAVASAASDSIAPIIIFFMGIVFTLIWPKFGREKLQKKTVLVHFIATVLVVIGIVILRI